MLLQSCLHPSPLSPLCSSAGPTSGCCGREEWCEGLPGAWAGATHTGVSLCLPTDDCLRGFLAQGLLLQELLQHLGPASGQRVPHLLWHPVSRAPSAMVGHAARNGCQTGHKTLEGLPALCPWACDRVGVGPLTCTCGGFHFLCPCRASVVSHLRDVSPARIQSNV